VTAIKRLLAAIEREPIALALSAALLAACLMYRVELASAIYSGDAKPVSLRADHVPVPALLHTLLGDWCLVVLVTVAYAGLKAWLRLRAPRIAGSMPYAVAEIALGGAIVLLAALILRIHYQLLLQLETGLTVTMVTMAPAMFAPTDFFHMFTLADTLFLATTLAVYTAALAGARLLRRVYRPALLAFTGVVLVVQLVPARTALSRELKSNPVIYFARDIIRAPLHLYFGKANPYRNRPDLPSPAQLHSIRLIDPAFTTGVYPAGPEPAAGPALHAGGKPWNVLLFVLESTGSDYVFDTSLGNEVPMPFLREMTDQGLALTNHHASCNSSPSAAFSIFTGLYPRPTHEPFSMLKTAAVPTINHYLAPDYECFLVHPSSFTYSFPEYLLRNNDFRSLDNLKTLPPATRPDPTDSARNELDAVDFLEQRLDRAREPFFGIYWSFIPHHPYSDYGPDYRIRPDLKNNRDLYYNNLRCLDTQLRRVYEHLRKTGRLDHTVLVFVGDHGQAFGQHPGVWAHSFGSYSEMYRTPMVFWQPKLIPGRRIGFATSHVDILPTLLDLLRVRFDPARFQGESVLRGAPARKYIFSMDAQADYVTAIDREMNKVSLSFEHGAALAFNLAQDPRERFPLNDEKFPEQIEAILKFCNYQTRLINDYNAAILEHRQF
jgi:hypothetical protein